MDAWQAHWREAYEAAARAFPTVTLAVERFVAHASDVGFTPGGNAGKEDLASADLFLACAAGDGDRAALEILEERYLRPAAHSLKRLEVSDAFIEDVMQELRARLFLPPQPRILRYGGRGPLLAWLRVVAHRMAIDSLRTARDDTPTREADLVDQVDLGPEVHLLRTDYRESFRHAMSAALADLSAKDRNLLRRHLVEGMTLQEMANPYGVHPATVARRLMALRETIATAVRDKLAVGPGSPREKMSLDSMARAIRSQVYVSLAPLLEAGRASSDGPASSEGNDPK